MATVNIGLTTLNGTDAKRDFPSVYNGNLNKLDALGVDFIVEQGTSGVWNYEKWNSGKIVASCSYSTGSIAVSTAYGNIYISTTLTAPSLPSAFLTIKNISHLLDSVGNVGGVCINRLAENFPNIKYYVWLAKSQTLSPVIHFRVEGTWK